MNTGTIEMLLIEDNIHDAELIIRELKKHNMANNLVHLTDGEEALKFIENNKDILPLKLIMMDIHMPKVDGTEVLEKLKSDHSTKSIPIVVLSSSRENQDIKKCYSLGANSYFVKPVNFEKFAETIKAIGMYWLAFNQPPV